MHEWLEGLQKSAKWTADGVPSEDVLRAETQGGVPFPEELGILFQRFNGGEFQGDVTLFALHGPEGSSSVMEKTRLKLEGLPAAGIWRIGVKGAHRQLFAVRKSALLEQSDEPLPGWTEALEEEHWLYGTWETERRELRLYRSLGAMLEVLVPPAEVEEFGDRTYANALSAVQGALSDLSVEYEDGARPAAKAQEDGADDAEDPEDGTDDAEDLEEDDAARAPAAGVQAGAASDAEEAEAGEADDEDEGDEAEEAMAEEGEADEEDAASDAEEDSEDEALSQPVVAAAQRRVRQLRKSSASAGEGVTRASRPAPAPGGKAPAKKAVAEEVPEPRSNARTKKAVAEEVPASRGTAPTKRVTAKAPAKKAPAKKGAAKKAPAKKTPAKKAPVKASARKAAAKAPAKKAPAKKGAAKKAPAKKAKAAPKAPAKKAAAKKATARRSRR